MPRGNDAAAAVAELADKFAAGEARAEDLQAASRSRVSSELREAQLKEIDVDATEEVDWDRAAKACEVDPQDVLDVAVRGDQVVVVYENDRGDSLKVACDADDAGVELARRSTRRKRQRAIEEGRSSAGGDSDSKPSKGKSRKASGSKKKS